MTQTSQSMTPRVVLDEMVYQKIMHWVNKSQYEVSGLGKVVVENGEVRIVSAYLLPQKNSHTTTDIEGADVGKLAWLTKDDPGELRFWWHSHVNMPVFWSGTDMATIKELGQNGWFVHTVFNKKHETRTAISMGEPFSAMIDDIKLVVERVLPEDLVNSWDKEYDAKVTNVVPKPIPTHGNQRFPQQHRQVSGPVFSQSDREEIARLAALMTEEDNSSLLREVAEDVNFPGLGSDGVYGDFDWPGMASVTKEHERGESTPQAVLRRRDELELRIEKYEERIEVLTTAGAVIPTRLTLALETSTEELSEVEDELDVLEQHGMIHNVDRYGTSDRAES